MILVLVNGDSEQYKNMNGKRPASAEPQPNSEAKKASLESNGSGIPEGSSISTTAGGQKVLTTPDGKQMIVKTAPNGAQVVVGTIDPVVTSASTKPLLNGGSNLNGNAISPPPPPAAATNSNPDSSSNNGSSSNSSLTVTSVPRTNPNTPFLCEWQGCMKAFKTPKEVEKHAIGAHCPLGADDIPCLWHRCDGMKRKRFSLMTHLQDRHCHPQVQLK